MSIKSFHCVSILNHTSIFILFDIHCLTLCLWEKFQTNISIVKKYIFVLKIFFCFDSADISCCVPSPVAPPVDPPLPLWRREDCGYVFNKGPVAWEKLGKSDKLCHAVWARIGSKRSRRSHQPREVVRKDRRWLRRPRSWRRSGGSEHGIKRWRYFSLFVDVSKIQYLPTRPQRRHSPKSARKDRRWRSRWRRGGSEHGTERWRCFRVLVVESKIQHL